MIDDDGQGGAGEDLRHSQGRTSRDRSDGRGPVSESLRVPRTGGRPVVGLAVDRKSLE